MALAKYNDYITAQNAVDTLYTATIGRFEWASLNTGNLITADTVNTLSQKLTDAAAAVKTINCAGYHTADHLTANSGYRSDRGDRSQNSFSSRNSYNSGERYY